MSAPSDKLGPVTYILMRHDPWCPMSYGEGTTCAAGCDPTVEIFGDEDRMAHVLAHDLRNRAQRRAAAKKKGVKP